MVTKTFETEAVSQAIDLLWRSMPPNGRRLIDGLFIQPSKKNIALVSLIHFAARQPALSRDDYDGDERAFRVDATKIARQWKRFVEAAVLFVTTNVPQDRLISLSMEFSKVSGLSYDLDTMQWSFAPPNSLCVPRWSFKLFYRVAAYDLLRLACSACRERVE